MPYVIPADAEKFSIYKTIESIVKVPVAYRTRKCDMLSVPESTSFTWRLSNIFDKSIPNDLTPVLQPTPWRP